MPNTVLFILYLNHNFIKNWLKRYLNFFFKSSIQMSIFNFSRLYFSLFCGYNDLGAHFSKNVRIFLEVHVLKVDRYEVIMGRLES